MSNEPKQDPERACTNCVKSDMCIVLKKARGLIREMGELTIDENPRGIVSPHEREDYKRRMRAVFWSKFHSKLTGVIGASCSKYFRKQ